MIKTVLWIDDVRNPPNRPGEQYIIARSVNDAKTIIEVSEQEWFSPIDYISIDHDAGDYVNDGGDYIKLLDWFEETGRNYPIRIHSMNPVGMENMRRIIQRNGWTEVK